MNRFKNKLNFIKNINTGDFNIKFLSIVAYLGPLFLMGKFSVEIKDKSLQFHVNQGMRLFIFEALSSVIFLIIAALIREIFPITILAAVYIIWGIVGICWICMACIGISNVLNSKMLILPIIGGKMKN